MKNLTIVFALLFSINAYSQQTVGLFLYSQDALPGYTLFAPANTYTTYLIDNCGDLQYSWPSVYKTGHTVELMEDGTLLRACNFQNGSPISGGGGGGRIEALSPDLQVAWAFEYANDSVRLHHDFEIMPNGNILMIAWELKDTQTAIDFGRDPLLVGANGMYPEHIIEYNPTTQQIDWVWHAWDHIIQDFDAGKPNYGVVADHPELFNLNFDAGAGAADWQHFNAMDYNAGLDQIIFSSPKWNEIYIIDHSTSTAEAAGHTGGLSGQGGDILWRWGNPEMYGQGDSTDRKLFGQHDVRWIEDGFRHGGKITVYNNGKGRIPDEYSTIDVIAPSILPNGDYEMNVNNQFLPASHDYSYSAPVPTDFYSHNISGAQMLENGNIMICEGSQGHFFEVDSLDNLVWDYRNPAVTDSIMEQEEVIPGTQTLNNRAFRALRYVHDFPGLTFLPLVNQGPIELNPYTSTCVTQIGLKELQNQQLLVYPSPAQDEIFIEYSGENPTFVILNNLGQLMSRGTLSNAAIDVKDLSQGIYYVSVIDEGYYYTTTFIKE
ncbi:MAG: aryl-sulfate sulfotransferase [Crocinitomicaceae bacterium]|nr:aryl-sulfate sulfotransferase [Crocinitomicaceae bacterium]